MGLNCAGPLIQFVFFFSNSESHSVMSNSSQPHGLYSSWKSQDRILEWVAYPFSRRSSQLRNQTGVSSIAGRFFTIWASREAKKTGVGSLSLLQWIFPTQESNWGLLHCRQSLYQLSYEGSHTTWEPTLNLIEDKEKPLRKPRSEPGI